MTHITNGEPNGDTIETALTDAKSKIDELKK
ncbi:hypothetical protein QF004_001630 [Chryseobacterium sp. MDT2-18]|nr:hypothetical protein [Chryseobacterium sp. MDT2-18]